MSDQKNREALPGVAPLFVERWSPRAFAKADVDEATLARLLEAARWSPSCFNDQPWRFYTSNSATFAEYLALLMDGNQAWAKDASVIGFLVGKKQFGHNGKPNPSYALDCGAAWMAMTLQARLEGLYTHGMAGIHHAKIATYFGLDTDAEEVMMAFAIGKIGAPEQLDDATREREFPSPRKSLVDIWLQK